MGLERGDVILQAAPLIGRRRGLEARELEQRIAALEILVDAFLEHRAEHVPDLGVGRGSLSASRSSSDEHAARHALSDRGKQRTFLDFLARHIERQIGAVDQTAHETQIARQYLGIVGDEDALDVELDAAGAVGIEQVERPRAGNEQQRRVVLPSLGAEMNGQRRLVERRRRCCGRNRCNPPP